MNKFDDKVLLTVQELMEYTGLGETKVRQLLNNTRSTFTIRNGNKLYAHKKLFDAYLEKCAKFQLKI